MLHCYDFFYNSYTSNLYSPSFIGNRGPGILSLLLISFSVGFHHLVHPWRTEGKILCCWVFFYENCDLFMPWIYEIRYTRCIWASDLSHFTQVLITTYFLCSEKFNLNYNRFCTWLLCNVAFKYLLELVGLLLTVYPKMPFGFFVTNTSSQQCRFFYFVSVFDVCMDVIHILKKQWPQRCLDFKKTW